MTRKHNIQESLEMVQLSLDELGFVTGGKIINMKKRTGKKNVDWDEDPPQPYFPC